MRCRSSHFGGHRSGKSDSHKTFEFSGRKPGIKKRTKIRDESGRGSHLTVDFRLSRKRLEFRGLWQKTDYQGQYGTLAAGPLSCAIRGVMASAGIAIEPCSPTRAMLIPSYFPSRPMTGRRIHPGSTGGHVQIRRESYRIGSFCIGIRRPDN